MKSGKTQLSQEFFRFG